jgi:hypothetical protein
MSAKKDMVEWGFDLTDVKSDADFLLLLGEFGFKKVSSLKPTDKVYPDSPYTAGMGFEDRFTSFHDTFQNPSGIRITVEHMGGKGSENGALGYIGIKAPKSAEPELLRFLAKFRGSKPIKSLDWNGRAGIARYVKEENPYDNRYITVR